MPFQSLPGHTLQESELLFKQEQFTDNLFWSVAPYTFLPPNIAGLVTGGQRALEVTPVVPGIDLDKGAWDLYMTPTGQTFMSSVESVTGTAGDVIEDITDIPGDVTGDLFKGLADAIAGLYSTQEQMAGNIGDAFKETAEGFGQGLTTLGQTAIVTGGAVLLLYVLIKEM